MLSVQCGIVQALVCTNECEHLFASTVYSIYVRSTTVCVCVWAIALQIYADYYNISPLLT